MTDRVTARNRGIGSEERRRTLAAVYSFLLSLPQTKADGEQHLGGDCSPSADDAQGESPETHDDLTT